MNAQSREVRESRSSIKQFCEIAHDNYECLLKLEVMQTGIDKMRAEIDKLTGDNDNGDPKVSVLKRKVSIR